MKIAVIGGGITGMGTTLALAEHCDVHLFEADTRFGGHANTAEVAFGDRVVPVDTGFIVFNDIKGGWNMAATPTTSCSRSAGTC